MGLDFYSSSHNPTNMNTSDISIASQETVALTSSAVLKISRPRLTYCSWLEGPLLGEIAIAGLTSSVCPNTTKATRLTIDKTVIQETLKRTSLGDPGVAANDLLVESGLTRAVWRV